MNNLAVGEQEVSYNVTYIRGGMFSVVGGIKSLEAVEKDISNWEKKFNNIGCEVVVEKVTVERIR